MVFCSRHLAAAFVVFFMVVGAAGPAAAARYASIVVEAETGAILYSRNADHRRFPASLVKMMTLYLTFESLEGGRISLDQALTVSKRAAGQTPSKLGLKHDSTITVEDAILAVVTKSANDAATVLAEALGETEIQFAARMTERAKTLGMVRTRFTNATGLPNRRQRTTARDMATLAFVLLDDFPQYYHYFATPEFRYNERTYENHNQMLRSYSGTDGIKTGYIRASGFNLVASVQRGERRLIGVVFGGRTARSRDAHLRDLLDKAFAHPQLSSLVPIPGPKPPHVGAREIVALNAPAGRSSPVRPAAVEQAAERPPAATAAPAVRRQPEPTLARAAPELRLTRAAPELTLAHPASGRRETRDPLALALLEQRAPARLSELWGVQIGAFSRADAARREIARVATAEPNLIATTDASITETQTTRGTLYRARFVGLSETAAREACRRLIDREIGCVAVQIQGVSALIR